MVGTRANPSTAPGEVRPPPDPRSGRVEDNVQNPDGDHPPSPADHHGDPTVHHDTPEPNPGDYPLPPDDPPLSPIPPASPTPPPGLPPSPPANPVPPVDPATQNAIQLLTRALAEAIAGAVQNARPPTVAPESTKYPKAKDPSLFNGKNRKGRGFKGKGRRVGGGRKVDPLKSLRARPKKK